MADHSFMSIPGFWLGGKFCPLIAGGSGEDEGEGGEGTEGVGTEGTEGGESAGGSEGEGGEEGGSSDDVEALKKEISKLRKENAKRRTDTKAANQGKQETEDKLKAVAKVLGLNGEEEVDVDALKEQLGDTASQLKTLKIENALSRAARKHGADPEALADSRSFMKKAGDLDPDDDSFASDLESLVESAVKNNPKLKTGSKPGKSSGEFNDSSDDGKKVSLDAAIAKGDAAAINKALDAELEAGRKK